MSTKSLPKNRRKPLEIQGFLGLEETGVYQNVYHGHFLPPETVFPGAFFMLSSLLRGTAGASYLPDFSILGKNGFSKLNF